MNVEVNFRNSHWTSKIIIEYKKIPEFSIEFRKSRVGTFQGYITVCKIDWNTAWQLSRLMSPISWQGRKKRFFRSRVAKEAQESGPRSRWEIDGSLRARILVCAKRKRKSNCHQAASDRIFTCPQRAGSIDIATSETMAAVPVSRKVASRR